MSFRGGSGAKAARRGFLERDPHAVPLHQMGLGSWMALWHGHERILHTGGHTGYRNLHAYLHDLDFDILLLSKYGFGRARETLSNAIYEAAFGAEDAKTHLVEMDKGYIKPV